jgi:uncharacterized protein
VALSSEWSKPVNQNNAIANPCINICRMDQAGIFCQGCKRTLLEIGSWDRMTAQQKADLTALLEQRKNQVT